MATSSASLDRSPRKNWVERAGNLPPYVRKVARAIERERGIPLDKAIPYAIGRVRRWAAGGDGVSAATKTKAAAAIAAWEALKAKSGKLRESVEPPTTDDLDFADDELIALADRTEDPLAVQESALALPVDVGNLRLLEATSMSGRDAQAREGRRGAGGDARKGGGKDRAKNRTRGGGDADFERDHPRSRGGEWTVKQGAKGDEVRALQRRVGAKADGDFGAQTRQKIMDFQRRNGLTVDGVVGRQTIAAMRGDADADALAPGKMTAADRKWLRTRAQKKDGRGRRVEDTGRRVRESAAGALAETFDIGDLSLLESRGGLTGRQRRDRKGQFADVPGVGDDAPKGAGTGSSGPRTGKTPAGRGVRLRRESSGAWVVEKEGDSGRWLPNRFTADDAGRRAADKHFDALSAGGEKAAAREQGERMGLIGAAGAVRSAKALTRLLEDLGDSSRAATARAAALDLEKGDTAKRRRAIAELRSMRRALVVQKRAAAVTALDRLLEQASTIRESAGHGALELRLSGDLRLRENPDAHVIRESFDLAVVDGHGALSLVEAAVTPDALFNADGTIDFVIIRPCNGRGMGKRIYEAAVLERDAHVFAGWPVYDNHDSPEAARARRGIPRPPSELAGEIRESWWDPEFATPQDDAMGFEQGAVIGRFMLTEDMERLVRRLPRAVKTSVNAQATGMHVGSRRGRRGMIVEGILNDPENSSVDLVTKAGAGGQVAALYRQLAA